MKISACLRALEVVSQEGDLLRAEATELRSTEAKQQALSDEQAELWRSLEALEMLRSPLLSRPAWCPASERSCMSTS